ncbi:MAG: trigger factor [Planctomycetaceae bacterium]|nr:trigger factor [Planctomycetaceae bacterium]
MSSDITDEVTPDVHETDAPENRPEDPIRLSLEVEVESPGDCQRHVTVTVARADIDRYLDNELGELMPTAEVPGFRPGRAPRELVAKRFKDEVSDKVKGSLLLDSLEQVSEDHQFSAISEPDLDIGSVELPREGDFTFEFDIEVRPEFELPEWKGLELERPVREFNSEDVDERLQRLLTRYAERKTKDGPVALNDYLTVDIAFKREGKVLSEIEGKNIQLKPKLSLRDAQIDDFGSVVEGANAGDVCETKVTLGDQVPDESLRGQDVDLEIDILEVQHLEPPELNQEFLDQIGGFTDEGDLRDAVLDELKRQLEYRQNQRIREQITAVLTSAADWELPPELLERQSNRELQRALMELRSAGFDNDAIQAYANTLQQNSMESTRKALKEHFIFERIAEDENIEAADPDYDDEIQRIALQSDESPRRVRARLEKRGQMDTLSNQIVERKVIELICSQATFSEVEVENPIEDTTAMDHAIVPRDESDIPVAKHGGDAQALQQPADRS